MLLLFLWQICSQIILLALTILDSKYLELIQVSFFLRFVIGKKKHFSWFKWYLWSANSFPRITIFHVQNVALLLLMLEYSFCLISIQTRSNYIVFYWSVWTNTLFLVVCLDFTMIVSYIKWPHYLNPNLNNYWIMLSHNQNSLLYAFH